jgi:protein-disulfide isomerase
MKTIARVPIFAVASAATILMLSTGTAGFAGQAAPLNFDLQLAGAATKGRADAPLVILEFSDFECPFCGRFSRGIYFQIQREYVDTGKVRYVYRHLPIERIHPNAMKAAEAAQCALAQGKFWEMHDRLFANQKALALPNLIAYAQVLGLNPTTFQQCLAGQTTARVRQDLAEGLKAGITGTPAFFIGTVTKEGKLKVLHKLIGAKPYATFKATLDSLVAQTAAAK